ncbi:MAG: hypothetical protein WA908_01670 [Pontixanthobacter sp.]
MSMGTAFRSTDPREAFVYEALSEAARTGGRAPTNQHLADELDLGSPSQISAIIGSLERRKLISVERFATQRRVTIAQTGKSTAITGNPKPHWRYVGVSQERHRIIDRQKREERRRKATQRQVLPTPVKVEIAKPNPLVTDAKAHADRYTDARKLAATIKNPFDHGKPVSTDSAPACEDDPRTPALSRGPCPRCGTRGDLGCKHQKPYEEAPAPR